MGCAFFSLKVRMPGKSFMLSFMFPLRVQIINSGLTFRRRGGFILDLQGDGYVQNR